MGKVKENWVASQHDYYQGGDMPDDYTGLVESQNAWKRMSKTVLPNGKSKYSINAASTKQAIDTRISELPVANWILNHIDNLKEGDGLIWKDKTGKVNTGKFIDFFGETTETLIIENDETGVADLVDWHETVVYIDPLIKKAKPLCSCGAKHTSQPNFHLSFCDIK